MTQLYLDIETASRADLRRGGAYIYAADPSTQLLLLSYAFGPAGDVRTWSRALGEPMPQDLHDALLDPQQTLVAHNAAFERTVLPALLPQYPGIREPRRWRCTMALAYSLALPGSLEELGVVLGLPEDKAKVREGRRLVQRFCTPKRDGAFLMPEDDPDGWMAFVQYSRSDVTALQEVAKRLGRWALPAHEQALWELDQRINDAGLPVDLELVDAAIAVRELDESRALDRSRELTELDNPNSRDQLLTYLQDAGVAIADLTKASVGEALRSESLAPEIREILELRRGLSKTSIKKFQSLRDATGADGRIRGTLQYAGAGRTWRWSGRIFQPQNLSRGTLAAADVQSALGAVKTRDESLVRTLYSDTPGVLSSLIRPAICAPPGRSLVACDYASIETVMLAWAAGSNHLLGLIRKGLDPYKDFASARFGVPYDNVTKKQRTWAKPAVLGCGYMLGAKGLVAYAQGYGVPLDETEAQTAVDNYRNRYDDIPAFWWAIDAAVRHTIIAGQPQAIGPFRTTRNGPFLQIELPSGRALSYLHPRIEDRETPWGQVKPQITYMGRDTGTKLQRISTHPGKLTENIVQAVARDVLAYGLTRAAEAGLQIIGHVHDEIIVECPASDATGVLDQLSEIMSEAPPWCADAPIRAEGWHGSYYRKD